MRELQHRTNNAYDTMLLVEDGIVIAVHDYDEAVHANPGDLDDWAHHSGVDSDSPDDYGDLVEADTKCTSTTITSTAAITIDSVDAEIQQEESAVWIRGEADVTCGDESYQVKVGCWQDTDDDHDSWSSDHEGLRILATCLDVEAGIGGKFHAIFADVVSELGLRVCQMLRDEVTQAVD